MSSLGIMPTLVEATAKGVANAGNNMNNKVDKVVCQAQKIRIARDAGAKDTFILAAGTAGSVAAATAVSKSAAAKNLISKGVAAVTTKLAGSKAFTQTIKPLAKKAIGFVKLLPPQAKLVLGAGLAVTALIIAKNDAKACMEQGKVEQKHEDKRAINNAFKEM